ncbi:MAG: Mrp/NBP35 family ATP-binding protein [Proteobacteria bacterium]|nr:Mrp/NBP35 family ATP-binding protein [Pseudomonadota bacterium]
MPAPTPDDVKQVLTGVHDPVTGKDVIAAGLIEGLTLRGGHISFAVEVAPERGATAEPLRKACEDAVNALPGVLSVTAVLTAQRPAQKRAPGGPSERGAQSAPGGTAPHSKERPVGLPGVGAIVAVASGKGGVGKSTVAVNLALGLAALGLKTGILDADIYGPSLPRLLSIKDKPRSDGKKLQPIEKFGLRVMSIGFLIDQDTPMIWRGPMVMGALTQLLNDVEWAPLDVLIVDMPPGTGDAQLTLAQRVPLAGAVIVSTPQDLALIDARKGLAMFRKMEVPVLGIVENMSVFACPHCGHETHIFGHDGARAMAEELGCDFLGAIPLVPAIRETSDAGTPIMTLDKSGPEAQVFLALARKVAAKLKTGQRAAPKIVME